jgi:hypothetical protein
MNKIEYQGWTAELIGKILTITKDGESREYDIKQRNNGIEYAKGVNPEYFIIRTIDDVFYYQFKFEENNFFVGDKYFNNDEHLGEFASHVFGE